MQPEVGLAGIEWVVVDEADVIFGKFGCMFSGGPVQKLKMWNERPSRGWTCIVRTGRDHFGLRSCLRVSSGWLLTRQMFYFVSLVISPQVDQCRD